MLKRGVEDLLFGYDVQSQKRRSAGVVEVRPINAHGIPMKRHNDAAMTTVAGDIFHIIDFDSLCKESDSRAFIILNKILGEFQNTSFRVLFSPREYQVGERFISGNKFTYRDGLIVPSRSGSVDLIGGNTTFIFGKDITWNKDVGPFFKSDPGSTVKASGIVFKTDFKDGVPDKATLVDLEGVCDFIDCGFNVQGESFCVNGSFNRCFLKGKWVLPSIRSTMNGCLISISGKIINKTIVDCRLAGPKAEILDCSVVGGIVNSDVFESVNSIVIGTKIDKMTQVAQSKSEFIGCRSLISGLPIMGNVSIQTMDHGTRKTVFSGFASAPKCGRWSRGDMVFNERPGLGDPIGWMCISPGCPGIWKKTGRQTG